MHTLAILTSQQGEARLSRYIKTAIDNRRLPNTKIGVVIGSEPDAAGLAMAQEFGIPNFCINKTTHGVRRDAAIRDVLLEHGVELVLLVGYRKKVGPVLLQAFPWRILNMHGAPIPQFGGKGLGGISAEEAVLAAGAPYTGPVIHIVNEEYDRGQILAHHPIKVGPTDTAESLYTRCNDAGRELWVTTLQRVLIWLDYPEDF